MLAGVNLTNILQAAFLPLKSTKLNQPEEAEENAIIHLQPSNLGCYALGRIMSWLLVANGVECMTQKSGTKYRKLGMPTSTIEA